MKHRFAKALPTVFSAVTDGNVAKPDGAQKCVHRYLDSSAKKVTCIQQRHTNTFELYNAVSGINAGGQHSCKQRTQKRQPIADRKI